MTAAAARVTGAVWKFGDNVDTDVIFPGWMLGKVKGLEDLSAAAMAGVDPNFHKKLAPGDFVVAGENFGCGSSRESAPLSLLHAGVGAVIAKSFGHIFYRNCVNVGLRPIVSAAADLTSTGTRLELDIATKTLRVSSGRVLPATFPSGICETILEAGGLMASIRGGRWQL